MNRNERILILTGDMGEGHKQAAQALLESSPSYLPHADVKVVDFMAVVSPRLHVVSKYLFIQGVKTFPSVYGYFFQKTRKPNTLSTLLKKLTVHGASRLLQVLHAYQPTVVVSTLPAAAAAMSALKTSGATRASTVTVMTDHTDHSYWLYPDTDLYIVGSERVRRSLNDLGIDDAYISVTGIPIRASFCRKYNALRLREQYNLSPTLPTILIMGGGHGFISPSLIKMLRSDAIQQRLQFIIICGHNHQLKERLDEQLLSSQAGPESAQHHAKHRIIVKGYVKNVHEFMALSDLIITKPGGLTTSEAIAMQLPMLLYRALPGQEQDNVQFLVEAGVAVEAKNEQDLLLQLDTLISTPHRLSTMRERARQFPMRDATSAAWKAIRYAFDIDHVRAV